MGLKNDGSPNTNFSPNNQVTRAQFGTTLSRALWGDIYNNDDGTNYYVRHLQALNHIDIMKKITNPFDLEKR